ncbi:methyltransferase domain-containing protein [Clostridium sp. OM05-6BH]|uniref:MerR family transcriptional regulator n=1 Tax=unclassified Clostridium TaxID=2614128 RepID=UPI000E4CB63B|nr:MULTISPECIES: methyltransferase domain-containing protein [unclassified Clostridium]RHQ13933.1 methyltransferase domain-containing protein [Clostridium sp. AM49-4BH]RHV10076.1 methyltransferase domain-containing protein [Clostridium sp. OM05-9BH]RHV16477.1 methyltransferase domain-containing protein [Clostridium sp. OM05-6BH]
MVKKKESGGVYYSSGEFARMAQITVRTVRYYDKQNILKPSLVTPTGARFYTEEDFARLQQIMLLKYLGFSLEDIRELTVNDSDYSYLEHSLEQQQNLVRDRIEQLQLVEQAIGETVTEIRQQQNVDWNRMRELIHLTGMENSLKAQYRNSTNISARIRLHRLFSSNKQGWFPWIYEQCQITEGMKILELGCGNGRLWIENKAKLPADCEIILSDISEGMIRDVRREQSLQDDRFSFAAFDCHAIPYEDASFDLVIANHVLFYCKDVDRVCSEVGRVLKPGGRFVCGTYGVAHMQEVSRLVTQFDDRITLSGENLYEHFGKENGAQALAPYFAEVDWQQYEDALIVTQAEPLIEYVLSCHGNQNQYILEKYNKFRKYVEGQIRNGYTITKDAGIFISVTDANDSQ